MPERTAAGVEGANEEQKTFFQYPGPLFSALITPSTVVIGIGETRRLRALARDKSRRQIDVNIGIAWRIAEGGGRLSAAEGEFVEYTAPDEPGIHIVEASISQFETFCSARCVVTVTDQIIPRKDGDRSTSQKKGLPGYTYVRAPGELWRSRYEIERHIVIINNGHADFVFASKNPGRKIKYILRLYMKELVLANFPEATREELMERMVELMLYSEEHLR